MRVASGGRESSDRLPWKRSRNARAAVGERRLTVMAAAMEHHEEAFATLGYRRTKSQIHGGPRDWAAASLRQVSEVVQFRAQSDSLQGELARVQTQLAEATARRVESDSLRGVMRGLQATNDSLTASLLATHNALGTAERVAIVAPPTRAKPPMIPRTVTIEGSTLTILGTGLGKPGRIWHRIYATPIPAPLTPPPGRPWPDDCPDPTIPRSVVPNPGPVLRWSDNEIVAKWQSKEEMSDELRRFSLPASPESLYLAIILTIEGADGRSSAVAIPGWWDVLPR